MTSSAFAPLPPLVELQTIIAQPTVLFDHIDRATAPLAITLPAQIKTATNTFWALFEELSLPAQIYVAHKATNSQAAIESLRGLARLDIASLAELNSATRAGFLASELVASGPKTDEFLARLVSEQVTIAVDSYEELERLSRIVPAAASYPILLRLSRSLLNMTGISRQSRFGLDQAAYERALDFIKHDQRFDLRGVSYHLDTTSLDEKYHAMRRGLEELLRLQDRGFEATVLDSGGGFGMDYGMTQAQLQALVATLKKNDRTHQSATWQNVSYGLNAGKGELKGIDIPSTVTGADRLKAILTRPDSSGHTLAQSIGEHLIELWIEPGSAIFGSSGMLVTRVIETKYLDGEHLVIVDAHRNQLCFENNETPLDPILISQSPTLESVDAFVAGHLCLESDFLTYRKIHFGSVPRGGDVLVWTHTGAYRSYFSTSRAIGHPLPRPVTYVTTDNSYILEEAS